MASGTETGVAQHDERDADLLLHLVARNQVREVEACLGNGAQWRDVIRYEVSLVGNGNGRLDETLVVKLMSCEVTNITAFHLAALLGLTDIIVSFIDHDVPVDFPLQTSGSTAIHLASFAGNTDMLNLLLDVYKADVNITDRYGWTSLHYAATQGHLAAVQILVSVGIDMSARDHDGTTAAFRAQINGHNDVTDYLRSLGCSDEMFELVDAARQPPIYSQPNKAKKTTNQNKTKPSKEPNYVDVDFSEITTSSLTSVPTTVTRHQSSASERPVSGLGELLARPVSRSQTLPLRIHGSGVGTRRSVVRRVIRQELEAAFSSPYEEPVKQPDVTPELFSACTTGPSLEELRGLMRQEIEKYKNEILPLAAAPGPVDHTYASVEEDPYSTLEELVNDMPAAPAPEPPRKVPPLPPRNQHMVHAGIPTDIPVEEDEDEPDVTRTLNLKSSASTNAGLSECLPKVAPLLGDKWKQLARALPIERSTSRVEQRIRAIEARHPGDQTTQAAMALAEWRINQRQDAVVDTLVAALRKCNMHSLIGEVESITQEFAA